MAGTNTFFTSKDLIDEILEDWTGSKANSRSRKNAIRKAQLAWQKIVAIGNEVGDAGWPWMEVTVAFTQPSSPSTVPLRCPRDARDGIRSTGGGRGPGEGGRRLQERGARAHTQRTAFCAAGTAVVDEWCA